MHCSLAHKETSQAPYYNCTLRKGRLGRRQHPHDLSITVQPHSQTNILHSWFFYIALLAEDQGSAQITAIIKNYLGLEQTNSLQKEETTGREMEKQRVKKIKELAQGPEGLRGLRHRATPEQP